MQKLFVFLCFLIILDLRGKNSIRWLNNSWKTDLFIGHYRPFTFFKSILFIVFIGEM